MAAVLAVLFQVGTLAAIWTSYHNRAKEGGPRNDGSFGDTVYIWVSGLFQGFGDDEKVQRDRDRERVTELSDSSEDKKTSRQADREGRPEQRRTLDSAGTSSLNPMHKRIDRIEEAQNTTRLPTLRQRDVWFGSEADSSSFGLGRRKPSQNQSRSKRDRFPSNGLNTEDKGHGSAYHSPALCHLHDGALSLVVRSRLRSRSGRRPVERDRSLVGEGFNASDLGRSRGQKPASPTSKPARGRSMSRSRPNAWERDQVLHKDSGIDSNMAEGRESYASGRSSSRSRHRDSRSRSASRGIEQRRSRGSREVGRERDMGKERGKARDREKVIEKDKVKARDGDQGRRADERRSQSRSGTDTNEENRSKTKAKDKRPTNRNRSSTGTERSRRREGSSSSGGESIDDLGGRKPEKPNVKQRGARSKVTEKPPKSQRNVRKPIVVPEITVPPQLPQQPQEPSAGDPVTDESEPEISSTSKRTTRGKRTGSEFTKHTSALTRLQRSGLGTRSDVEEPVASGLIAPKRPEKTISNTTPAPDRTPPRRSRPVPMAKMIAYGETISDIRNDDAEAETDPKARHPVPRQRANDKAVVSAGPGDNVEARRWLSLPDSAIEHEAALGTARLTHRRDSSHAPMKRSRVAQSLETSAVATALVPKRKPVPSGGKRAESHPGNATCVGEDASSEQPTDKIGESRFNSVLPALAPPALALPADTMVPQLSGTSVVTLSPVTKREPVPSGKSEARTDLSPSGKATLEREDSLNKKRREGTEASRSELELPPRAPSEAARVRQRLETSAVATLPVPKRKPVPPDGQKARTGLSYPDRASMERKGTPSGPPDVVLSPYRDGVTAKGDRSGGQGGSDTDQPLPHRTSLIASRADTGRPEWTPEDSPRDVSTPIPRKNVPGSLQQARSLKPHSTSVAAGTGNGLKGAGPDEIGIPVSHQRSAAQSNSTGQPIDGALKKPLDSPFWTLESGPDGASATSASAVSPVPPDAKITAGSSGQNPSSSTSGDPYADSDQSPFKGFFRRTREERGTTGPAEGRSPIAAPLRSMGPPEPAMGVKSIPRKALPKRPGPVPGMRVNNIGRNASRVGRKTSRSGSGQARTPPVKLATSEYRLIWRSCEEVVTTMRRNLKGSVAFLVLTGLYTSGSWWLSRYGSVRAASGLSLLARNFHRRTTMDRTLQAISGSHLLLLSILFHLGMQGCILGASAFAFESLDERKRREVKSQRDLIQQQAPRESSARNRKVESQYGVMQELSSYWSHIWRLPCNLWNDYVWLDWVRWIQVAAIVVCFYMISRQFKQAHEIAASGTTSATGFDVQLTAPAWKKGIAQLGDSPRGPLLVLNVIVYLAWSGPLLFAVARLECVSANARL